MFRQQEKASLTFRESELHVGVRGKSHQSRQSRLLGNLTMTSFLVRLRNTMDSDLPCGCSGPLGVMYNSRVGCEACEGWDSILP